jgi:hypothetical protein
MSRRLLWLTVVVAGLLVSTRPVEQAVQPNPPLNVYFGNLHSHTAYSDGTGTPQQAFDHARTQGRLDFLAITEHNHRNAGSTGNDPNNLNLAVDHSLYNGAQAASLMSTAASVNTQFANQFVALYGQEYSTNSDGNHVNVFDIGEVIDEDIVPNKRFDLFYPWITTRLDTTGRVPIVQLNHPASMTQDYGVLNFGTLEATLTAARPFVRTIQIINGPHSAQGTGNRVETIKSRSYLNYLNAGFRIAPTADQDNHFLTHGSATDHRSVVLAPSLTKRDILDGIRARRVYASQDRNLRVQFTIDGHPLGSVVQLAPNTPIRIEVQLTDPDEPNATYRVSLRRDEVGNDLEADHEFVGGDRNGNGSVVFDQFQHGSRDEYFLVQVVQIGTDGADTVWTAPIWLVNAGPGTTDDHPNDDGTPAHAEEFVWSQNSEVYHLMQCSIVNQISAANRRSGHQPPPGKRLHSGCPH